jgi:hypothetical protein
VARANTLDAVYKDDGMDIRKADFDVVLKVIMTCRSVGKEDLAGIALFHALDSDITRRIVYNSGNKRS